MYYYWIIYFLCNFFLMFVIRQLIRDFFEGKPKLRYEISAMTFFYVGTFLANFYVKIPIVNFIMNLLGIFLMAIPYIGNLMKKVLVTFAITLLCAVSDMATYLALGSYIESSEGTNASFIIAVLIMWICERIIRNAHVAKTNVQIPKKYLNTLLIVPACGQIMEILLCTCKKSGDLESQTTPI
ncbi:MAG: hypothetical protein EOM40_04105 [Clostridia bacterium]|nr:hypothetical protein [Clostridia bacterium]NCC44251.1 hypothetical protein [Clostridia bacterium]